MAPPKLTGRAALIDKLETKLNARLLVLVTGDRMGMETRIAPDLLPLISAHLNSIGNQDRLALFLYTPGGDTIAGWGLVNLLRQYCKKLVVLVPFRALSCGTLIALGADQIVMGRHGFLGPIDPSVNSPFNPNLDLGGQKQLLPVSVEDLIGFMDLARKEAKIRPNQMVEVLKILADKLHPLALGAVYRARQQSADLATRLLERPVKDKKLISRIVKRLTEELPTHNYLIGPGEAKDIGIPLHDADAETDTLMWQLYREYEGWLKLTQPFSPEHDLGVNQQANIKYERAVIESRCDGKLQQHVYVSDVLLLRMQMPGAPQGAPEQIGRRNLYEGWAATTAEVEVKE